MKRFLQVAAAMKEAAALCYSAAMCILLLLLFCFGQQTVSVRLLFSVLLAGFASGALQVAAFSDLLIKKLAYGKRMLVFVIPFFILLTAIAALFDWFPLAYAGAWALFAGIFLAIFLVLTAAFEWYYHLTGRKYNGLLGQYRQKKGR